MQLAMVTEVAIIILTLVLVSLDTTVCKSQEKPAKWTKANVQPWWTDKFDRNKRNTKNKFTNWKHKTLYVLHPTKSNNNRYHDNHDQSVVRGEKRDVFGPGATSNTESFNQAVLNAHNEYRQMHHSPHLDMDKQLSYQAQAYAKELSILGFSQLRHSEGYKEKKYGENIYVACGTHVFPVDPVKEWYTQVCEYDFLAHKPKREGINTEDFTQVVWRGTKELGVGCAMGLIDRKPCTYIVAHYLPRRNEGMRRNNVDVGDFNKEICKDFNYVGYGARG